MSQELPPLSGKVTMNSGPAKASLADIVRAVGEVRDAFLKQDAAARKAADETKKAKEAAAAAARKAKEEIGGLTRELTNFGEELKKGLGIGAGFTIGAKAAELLMGSIRGAVAATAELVAYGDKVATMGENFQKLAGSVSGGAQEMLKAGRNGVQGLASDYDIMASANKALLLGLPVTSKEFGMLSQAATSLGRAMGQDATKSLDDLITGLGRGSALILDNLGIVVNAEAAHEKYASSIGKTVESLSEGEKKIAVYNEAVKAMAENVSRLGDIKLTLADRLQQVNVMWQNLYGTVGAALQQSPALNQAFGELVGWLEQSATWIEENKTELVAFVEDGLTTAVDIMRGGKEVVSAFFSAFADVTGLTLATKAIETLTGKAISLADVLAGLAKASLNGMTYGMSGGLEVLGGMARDQDFKTYGDQKPTAADSARHWSLFPKGWDQGLLKMPNFGATGGGASTIDPFAPLTAGRKSQLAQMEKDAAAAAKVTEDKRAAEQKFMEESRKAWEKFYFDLRSMQMEDLGALSAGAHASSKRALAGLPSIEKDALASILSIPTMAGGKPKQYSFDNSRNFGGKESLPASADDAAKALQSFANIASLSSSKLGRTMAQVFGSGAGVAGGFDSLGKATSFIGKLGAIGSIASAGIGVISGIASLFGGGKEKRERAAAEAAEKQKAEQDAAAERAREEQRKRQEGLGTAASGFNAFAKGGGITDQASSDRAGMYASSIFGNQVRETGDVVGALRGIGPALAEMAEQAAKFGYSLSESATNLIGMSAILDADNGLADQLSGLNQMMRGLGEAGMMTKDLFAAFGADASAVFARLVEGGATGTQAMTMMQPTLQQLYEAQKKHGYAVDETTQALIDEAEAQGIVGDQFMSANERMVELLAILVETIGGQLPDAYRKAGDAAEDYARRGSNVPRPQGYHNIDDAGDGSGLGGPGFAGGTGFRDFGAGTQVTLHGRETVMTPPQVDRLVSMAVSGVAGSNVPQGGGGRPIVVHVMMDGRVAATAVTNTLEGEGPEAQRFRQAAAGRR